MKRKLISIIALFLAIIMILSSLMIPVVNAHEYQSIPTITIYSDMNGNITASMLKRYISEYTTDQKILSILFDIIDKSTTNDITNKTKLLDSIENSTYNDTIKQVLKDWLNQSLIVEIAYEDVTSDLDIFTVNCIKGYKKSFKINVMTTKNISGYQIKYSTNKKFKNCKSIKVTTNKSTYKVKNLKKKKTYYVKIRPYIKTSSSIDYGKWTKLKVKTK